MRPKENKVVRRLFVNNATSCDAVENLAKDYRRSDADRTAFLVGSVEPSCLPARPPKTSMDQEDDSWENLDDTKLEEYFWFKWDYFHIVLSSFFAVLPHVLEAYDVPEYVLADDVANALATTDFGSATVKWLERKMVFVVFESERQARDALVFHKHQWLRLRPLSKSPVRVQEKALTNEVGDLHLRLHVDIFCVFHFMFDCMFIRSCRPKTNVGIARRMVESTLGMRSSVSMERREVENKQLANAKGMQTSFHICFCS
ncbi:unnamed protein product [Angiostrongylus costaricensis]|uniref:RRM domain-containing protein n=1 Tax=Angiostrongylus costaricensis TaxID=334426 RepID=A0A3P7H7W6_ANGCS|nr:unnamed protein product [Angiostrongylus costaricensis]